MSEIKLDLGEMPSYFQPANHWIFPANRSSALCAMI